MEKRQCPKCKRTKPITDFNFKNKNKGRRHTRCKVCTRKQIMASYYKNRRYYLDYRAKRNKMLRREVGKFLYNFLLEHPCVDCGNNDPRVLHFDHVRGQKRDSVSILVRHGTGLKYVKEEIKKCDVRCANCHAIRTAEQFGYYAYIKDR